jgi:hypothetical protein
VNDHPVDSERVAEIFEAVRPEPTETHLQRRDFDATISLYFSAKAIPPGLTKTEVFSHSCASGKLAPSE